MSLAEALNSHLPFRLFHPKPSSSSQSNSKPFDETLILHLRSPSITLAQLSCAVDLRAADPAADASLALLDACNAASAAIELLRRRLLPLRLVASDPRGAIAEWAAPAPPRGGIWAVRGAINAVEAVAVGRLVTETEEVAAVERAVRKLTAVMDDGAETERLRVAILEVESVTEELTAGLDRLGRGVDVLFRAVMSSRNAALQRFRVGHKKCK